MKARKSLGAVLFLVYLACYAAFVGVAAFGTFAGGKPDGGLATTAVGGLPWGVVAGIGLIVGAFVLALAYAFFGADANEGGEAA
ncbi:MAG: DUF485 domain-containing protein [Planctomycetaceae bacterium]|jgi:uncharacterized membrane protein (DUF485 family)|nr:DUF485 domain-containing protein [Planctomycetaceae bacterium]